MFTYLDFKYIAKEAKWKCLRCGDHRAAQTLRHAVEHEQLPIHVQNVERYHENYRRAQAQAADSAALRTHLPPADDEPDDESPFYQAPYEPSFPPHSPRFSSRLSSSHPSSSIPPLHHAPETLPPPHVSERMRGHAAVELALQSLDLTYDEAHRRASEEDSFEPQLTSPPSTAVPQGKYLVL